MLFTFINRREFEDSAETVVTVVPVKPIKLYYSYYGAAEAGSTYGRWRYGTARGLNFRSYDDWAEYAQRFRSFAITPDFVVDEDRNRTNPYRNAYPRGCKPSYKLPEQAVAAAYQRNSILTPADPEVMLVGFEGSTPWQFTIGKSRVLYRVDIATFDMTRVYGTVPEIRRPL